MSMHYFSCSGGPVRVPQKASRDTISRTSIFLHPVGFAGHIVHSDGSKVQNIDTLFFHSELGLVQFPQEVHHDTLR
jgi:hypothetical protein